MKNKITVKLKDRKHRCVRVVQSLVSGLLFFLCILTCGCERRQDSESGLAPLEKDGLIASGAAAEGAVEGAVSAAESSASQAVEGEAGNGTNAMADEPGGDGVRQDSAGANAQQAQQATVCYVHIYGAVVNPGVYELQQGSRIFQAVSAAGGFTEEACQDYVNQARQVSDGMKIWIPTEKEALDFPKKSGDGIETVGTQAADVGSAGAGANPGAGAAGSVLVNINTATVEQLCTLNGIGESRAKTIIAYREAHGAFAKKEDIMKVTGIKESSYSKIKDQITVGEE